MCVYKDCGLDDSNSQLLCGLVTKNNIKELDLYGNSIQIGGARNIRDWLLAGASPTNLGLKRKKKREMCE